MNRIQKSLTLVATALQFAVSSVTFAAGPDQVGTFSGSMKLKGVHPVTGAKISTTTLIELTVAADNSTTLSVDGVDYFGQPDNFFGPARASLVLHGPGPTIITAPLLFKPGSVKGAIRSTSFASPYIVSNGKFKLLLTNSTPPTGFSGLIANGTPIAAEGLPKPIPDLSTTTSTITIAPVGYVADINVRVNLNHTFDGDLVIRLTSPSGTVRILSANNGGGSDNYTNTLFDDEAATFITSGAAPFNGNFRPQASLDIFDDEPVGGIWTLSIADIVGGDSGTLNSWSLQITSNSLP